MSEATPTATVKDLMTAAVATYRGDKAPTMPSQWSEVLPQDIASHSADRELTARMAGVGFYGQAYVNRSTGEVLIANRGTDNWQNFRTDVSVATEVPTDAQPVANQFARAALAAAQEQLQRDGTKMAALYTVGHSLGGAESEAQAAMLSVEKNNLGAPLVPKDVHITNLSIDAPGIGQLARGGDRSRYTSYNFSSRGDIVHHAGGDQLAGTIRVSLPIGPSIVQTAGYMGTGLALWNAPLAEAGTKNAWKAHSSALVLEQVSATPLADTKVSQLGKSAAEVLKLFVPSPAKAGTDDKGERSQGREAHDGRRADAEHMQIWGIDVRGNVDMTAVKDGANGAYAEQWLDERGFECRVRAQPKL